MEEQGIGGSDASSSATGPAGTPGRKRLSFARVVPEHGKKRVNYGKGDARRIMEEAVSLCEAMTMGYEVVFHGRRRSSAQKSGNNEDGRGRCAAELEVWLVGHGLCQTFTPACPAQTWKVKMMRGR